MFRIVSDNYPVEIEMSEDILDLALMIGSYIEDNLVASDFFTLGNTNHEGIKMLMAKLREKKVAMTSDGNAIVFEFEKETHRLFEELFAYGYKFWDDIGTDAEQDQIDPAAKNIVEALK